MIDPAPKMRLCQNNKKKKLSLPTTIIGTLSYLINMGSACKQNKKLTEYVS